MAEVELKERTTVSVDLFILIANNDLARLSLTIKQKATDLDQKNSEGQTALDLAVQSANLDVALLLIDKGANVNCINKYGLTPLHTVVKHLDSYLGNSATLGSRHGEAVARTFGITDKVSNLVKQLLNKGADPNLQDRKGNTVINYIAQKARQGKPTIDLYLAITRTILEHEKDPKQILQLRNNVGKASLDYLSRNYNQVMHNMIHQYLSRK